MSKENYNSRNHMLLLYPENECHKKAFDIITKSYDYASILHNRDKWTKEDEKKNPDHKAGALKKEHWHIVLRFPNARWASAICKELGIENNYIEQCKSLENSLQYLIHYNDENKTKYELEEVHGTLKTKLKESINKQEKSEGEKVVDLIEYIECQESLLSITDFSKYCALNGYWSEFRRSGAIFCKMIDEHNQRYFKNAQDGNY